MARAASTQLDAGDPLPELRLELVSGGSLIIPASLSGRWGVLLIYRGHW